MKRLVMAVIAMGLLAGGNLLAAGFAINEQGARSMAQAMAFVARADDPSALFYNPAGITQLEGTQFYFGATAIAQGTTWSNDLGTLSIESDDRWEIPPHMYVTHQLNEDWYFGFGFFVPYGLSKKWPAEFPGKYSSRNVRLQAFYLNPNIAYKINDVLSVAVGLDIVYSSAKLERDLYLAQIIPGVPDGYFSADVSGTGFGANAALLAKINDKLSFGASYRSQVKVDFDGDLTNTIPSTGNPVYDGMLASLFPNQEVETAITMPDVIQVGFATTPKENYTTELDFQWTNWSVYNTLPFIFSQPTQALVSQEIPKLWKDGYTLRWGNEYKYSESLDLRAGAYYDWNPVPNATLDPMLPDSNRVSFQAGFGWHNEKITLDVAYMYIYFFERDINNNAAFRIVPNSGRYESSAHLFGLSLGYRF
ncbi:MAG TPA: OmpP1/FadL family transporter [Acidobacteriota bacterium]|nr:transporter [Acidobacteriota bacterium]HOT01489.1 OmpP1/FadL family transporter [Acidobacteriota bacterium]HQF88749.1 OmpP1/FadL family transporter [Acidobacteriota bacterium]HQG93231.1 OmpP1/FadL family transporter [Acidobacteriota bacterium]